jgi:hypothetical protein
VLLFLTFLGVFSVFTILLIRLTRLHERRKGTAKEDQMVGEDMHILTHHGEHPEEREKQQHWMSIRPLPSPMCHCANPHTGKDSDRSLWSGLRVHPRLETGRRE